MTHQQVFPFAIKAVTEAREFEGYASVFGTVDRDDEAVMPGAFARAVKAASEGARFPAMLLHHNPTVPIGVWRELHEDRVGLFVRGLLADTADGRDAYQLMKLGALTGLSIGYRALKWRLRDNRVRELLDLDLVEVSPVVFPANDAARISAVKGATSFADLPVASDRGHGWDRAAADARVRRWAGGPEKDELDWGRYRKAFFWVDPALDEDVGGYKLQFADVIDGTLQAVARGVMACAGVMQGARGGVDIPESDRAAVRAHISRYYEKMRRQFEDESIQAPWKSAVMTEREFDHFLRDAGFSRSQAKRIIAKGYLEALREAELEDDAGILRRVASSLREMTHGA